MLERVEKISKASQPSNAKYLSLGIALIMVFMIQSHVIVMREVSLKRKKNQNIHARH